MAEQTASYSIEIKDQSTEHVTIFTFVDVTADEVRNVLTEFHRLLSEMAGAAAVSLLGSPRAGLAPDICRSGG